MLKYSIVAVAFPFSDNYTETKIRPVLCLTNAIGKYEEIIVCYITSKIPYEKLLSDIEIKKSEIGFENTGLLHSSTIRLHKLMTISQHEILGSLGTLPKNLHKEVFEKTQGLF
jgi:mRNA interferase MazF